MLNATKLDVKVPGNRARGQLRQYPQMGGPCPGRESRLSHGQGKCFVGADADEKTLREIWQAAIDGSPVTQTVARPTQIVTEFEK